MFFVRHAAFLFISLPGLSLLVSALFRWGCNISIHLFSRSVTACVRPFPLAMQHFCSFVSQACHWWCPPFSAGHVAFLFICLPVLSLLVSAPFCWPCSISIRLSPWCPPFSVGHVAFLFIFQVCHWWCPPVSALVRWPCSISIHLFPGSVTGAAALFRWSCSISIHLSPM